jgi:hypothetical protein
MNRTRLGVLFVSVLLLLLLPAGNAFATGTTGGGSSNAVSIQPYAQYDTFGAEVTVGLNVRCKSNALPGQIQVNVSQSPPETPYPVQFGGGINNVVCDGRTHAVAVSAFGEGMDAGRARVQATLMPPLGSGSSVQATRWVTIVAA